MIGNLDVGFRNLIIPAFIADSFNLAANLLHKVHTIKKGEQQRISGNTFVSQCFLFHSGRKSSRRYNFQTILENIDLDIGGGTVIPVDNRVDDRFSKRLCGKLQSFVPAIGVGNQGGIEPGLHVCHAVFENGVEVGGEIFPVQNFGLGTPLKETSEFPGGKLGGGRWRLPMRGKKSGGKAENAGRYFKPISPRRPKSRRNWAVATSASRGWRR